MKSKKTGGVGLCTRNGCFWWSYDEDEGLIVVDDAQPDVAALRSVATQVPHPLTAARKNVSSCSVAEPRYSVIEQRYDNEREEHGLPQTRTRRCCFTFTFMFLVCFTFSGFSRFVVAVEGREQGTRESAN
jgi:hypothetical protein